MKACPGSLGTGEAASTLLACPTCQKPLDTARFDVGESAIVGSGTLMPDLSPRLGLPNELDFIAAAQALLVVDPQARERLAVYHASTSLRVRAASKHLQAIRDLGTPLGAVMYNYQPSTESVSPDGDDREFDFEMRIFDFLMQSRSSLDVVAHEINFVYRYRGVTSGQDAFFNYENLKDESLVTLHSVRQKLQAICPQEPLAVFLCKEMKDRWFSYLTDLRDVNYHRRVLIGPREGSYSLRKLFRLRPTKVEPESVKLFLPDKPRLLWTEATYNQKLELIETFTTIHDWLRSFLDQVYQHLAPRLQ